MFRISMSIVSLFTLACDAPIELEEASTFPKSRALPRRLVS